MLFLLLLLYVTESIDESIFFIFKDFFSAFFASFGLFVDVSFDSFVKVFGRKKDEFALNRNICRWLLAQLRCFSSISWDIERRIEAIIKFVMT